MNIPHFHPSRRAAAAGRAPGPGRAGISLMEVLISIFVVSIGLLGIAALIPVANYALVETTKADRAAACGQAAIRDIRVRRLADPQLWMSNPTPLDLNILRQGWTYMVDPQGNVANFGGLIFKLNYDPAAAPLFTWRDDLTFDSPDNLSRPVAMEYGGQNFEGDYSWMFMVTPPATEDYDVASPPNGDINHWRNRRYVTVSVVVFHRRDRGLTSFPFRNASFVADGLLQLDNPIDVEPGHWILLGGLRNNTATNRPTVRVGHYWYRVAAGWENMLTVEGPTWTGNPAPIRAVFVPDVIGVYTTTVELNRSPEWWPQ